MYYSISMYKSCFYIFLNNDMYSYTLWYVQFRPGISWAFPGQPPKNWWPDARLTCHATSSYRTWRRHKGGSHIPWWTSWSTPCDPLFGCKPPLPGGLAGQQAADLKTSQKHIPSGNLKSRIPTYPWTLLEARCITSHISSAYNWSTHSGYPPDSRGICPFKEI